MNQRIFTSESVTEGHPDKMCDQIADSILDSIITKDSQARVACEAIVTTGMALVMGEISTTCYVDIPDIVRRTIKRIGYDRAELGFEYSTCAVLTSIDEQSPDIDIGVSNSLEFKKSGNETEQIGAGDQGMMFGYACNETQEYMPAPISLAHALTHRLAEVRRTGMLPFLRPDGKAQVTIKYDEDNRVACCAAIVVSAQHDDVDIEIVRQGIRETVIQPVIPVEYINQDTKIYINPTGRFVLGGPQGDSGLTGRKIIVDTYGGYARHGGGSFSGKDPTKVDRSAAYMARYAAKNLVAAGLCHRCEIELAYAIGVANPVSLLVDTFGTGVLDDRELVELVVRNFDFSPTKIIEKLDLRKPIYSGTATYGHFGRQDLDLPWERLDMVELLRETIRR